MGKTTKNTPKKWTSTTIGEIASVSTGGTPSTQKKEYWDGNIPWMSSGEVNLRRVLHTEKKITEIGLQNCNSAIFPKGSVMIALAGQGSTRGKTAILEIESACNQSLAAIRSLDKDVVLNDYIFYNLESRYLELRNINGNAGRSGLNLNLLKGIPILLPPPPEQKEITKILMSVDEEIDKTEKIIEKTVSLKKGLMQQLFTKGIGHKKFKKTKLGEIPQSWELITLGDIGTNVIGLTYSPKDVVHEGGTLVFRSSNIKGNTIVYGDNVFVNKEIRSHLMTKPGDILLCTRNGSRHLIGKSAYIDEGSAGNSFGAFMSVYRTKHSKFIFQLFQSALFKNQINKHLGATINQITTGVLNSFVFALPPADEQETISNILTAVDEKIRINAELKKKYTELKGGLTRDLLSGNVRTV